MHFGPQAARCCPSANPNLGLAMFRLFASLPKSSFMEETSECSATESQPHPSNSLVSSLRELAVVTDCPNCRGLG